MESGSAAVLQADAVVPGRPASAGMQPAEGFDALQADSDAVQGLREQKKNLMQQKKVLTRQLRNELRKRQRLRERAKKLSDEDLVRVLASREKERQAKGIAKSRPVSARARK